VDKAENVGIGTTTPKGKLHVDGGKTKLGLRGTDITIDAQDGGDGGGLGGDNGGHGGNIILLPGEGGEPGGFGSPGRPGNVGIGTTKPNYELDVVGNINFTDNLYQNGSLFPGGGSLWTENGSDIYFNAGNVGIGTTSPSAKLEVAGDVTVKKISEDVDISLVSGTGNSSKLLFGNRFEPGAAAIKFDNLTQVLSFKNWMTDDALVITQDGNVGIGTESPEAKLEVAGDMTVKKIGEDVDISLVSGTGSSSKLLFGNRFEPGAAAIKFDNLTQVLSFKNWMTDDALVITQDGDVGIGTTNPGAKLEVNGDLKVKGAYLGSFPRPAYDSGWVAVAPQMEKKLTHNLGGNVDNYVVDMQMKSGGSGINNFCIGTDTTGEYWYGASWRGLTTTSIWVFRAIDDYTAEQVRIRIWVYK